MKRSCSRAPEIIKHAAFAALLSLSGGIFFSCAGVPEETGVPPTGAEENHTAETDAEKPLRVLAVPSPQEVIFSGKAGEFRCHWEGNEKPEILFFNSPGDRRLRLNGSREIPVEAGTYYALVRLAGEEAFAEYRILKRPVRIKTKEFQEAVYNGDPRRVEASAEPETVLSYSYYPNREFRDQAIRAAKENSAAGNSARPRPEFKGYKRVARAPTEQGTYYVWIHFPGDKNHEPASASVEFTILPPGGG